MRMMKKFAALLLVAAMVTCVFTACGSKDAENTDKKAEITIAYQPSIGYAPLLVMKEKGLIEKAYDGDIKVNWKEMNNGSEITEALTAGSLDVGCVGVPVAVTGIKAGSPYRIAFGISAQPYAIQTNNPDIKSLKDITKKDQIGITNINSQPHILLAMWAKNELGDAHALDGNLTVLSNPDGYSSIVSGAVSCHMVISPFNFMETASKEKAIHEIPVDSSVWADDNTALVAIATQSLKNDRPEVYEALIQAADDADQYIADQPEEVAKILAKDYDASDEEILSWMQDSRSSYVTSIKGVMQMAKFMEDEGFIEEAPKNIDEIVYDNVKGE